MLMRLIVILIVLNGFALVSYALSRRGGAMSHLNVALAAATYSVNTEARKLEDTAAAEYQKTLSISANPSQGPAREIVSLLASVLRPEPAPSFLIGALLLSVATSLRLRVMRRSAQ
jgi:hypothetical protein